MVGLEPDRLRQIVSAYRLSQVVYACASLGIPDALAGGASTATEIAESIGANVGLVSRLLRAAASEGVIEGTESGYTVNEFSRQLCAGSMRDFVLGWSALRTGYLAFGYLDECIRTGRSGVELLSGRRFHSYMRDQPQEAARYANAMESTVEEFKAVAEAYDFGRHRRIVDVGGGQGTFLIAIRQVYPQVSGVLFDLADVVAAAPDRLALYAEGADIDVQAGDMFVDVPGGADAYLFSTVLRCFSDDECVEVLRICAERMRPDGHVLAVEMLMPSGIPPSPSGLADLQALVVYGGQDRTEHEWTELLLQAGFNRPQFHAAVGSYYVIDAARSPTA